MNRVWVVVVSVIVLALLGAIGTFMVLGLREADKTAEQNAAIAQEKAEAEAQANAVQQRQVLAEQTLKECANTVNQQYVNSVEDAKANKTFASQEAATKYLQALDESRNKYLEACKQQYTDTVEQHGLEIVPGE